jgi:hypothetical protein
MLALLALAAVPVVARAESSPRVIFHTPVSTLPQPQKVTPVEPTKPSEAPDSTKKPKTKTEKEPEEQEQGSSEKNKPAAGGGQGNGNGGAGNGQTGKSGIEGGRKVPGTESSAPAQELPSGQNTFPYGGGGSSPLVPILIVVVVLAAISIGVAAYRQRRGADGVSSPNAG